MSVQIALSRSLMRRILRRSGFVRIIDRIHRFLGFTARLQFWTSEKNSDAMVYFPYMNSYTHPDIKRRYYSDCRPIKWCNLRNSKIKHVLANEETVDDKPVIIEPNDHILTVAGSIGLNNPKDTINNLDRVAEYLNSQRVKKILVGYDELYEQAKFYFPCDIVTKVHRYSQFACQTMTTPYEHALKFKNVSAGPGQFLCIASDFEIKAVELVLRAFLEVSGNFNLTLVSHAIPEKW